MRRILVVVLMVLCGAVRANAWGGRGHQLVAYIAYMNLDPQVRAKVDKLVQQNPCIAEWQTQVQALPAAQQSVALFMLAATWPDQIKLTAPLSKTPYDCPGHPTFSAKDGAAGPDGHFSADNPPVGPEASQNIGYSDDRRHKYWHFIDTPFSTDGTATQDAPVPNVLTELVLLSHALGSNEDIKLRSYDMVWVEHLTGDIHQPLHVAERYSKALPNGDSGGNLVALCHGQSSCRAELHAYWDALPGSDSSLVATIKMGATLNKRAAPSAAAIDISHPEHWAADAVAMAKTDVYAAPFDTGAKSVDPATIPAAYHTQAVADMQKQISIAGWRLAGILENDLKGWSGT
jgi:hypothetical protein